MNVGYVNETTQSAMKQVGHLCFHSTWKDVGVQNKTKQLRVFLTSTAQRQTCYQVMKKSSIWSLRPFLCQASGSVLISGRSNSLICYLWAIFYIPMSKKKSNKTVTFRLKRAL